jgi:hypothetical protein
VLQCTSNTVMLECISVLLVLLVKSLLDSYVPQLRETLTEMATRELHSGIPQPIPTCIHVGWHLVPQIKHARWRTTSDPLASLLLRSTAHGMPKKKVAPLAGVVRPTSHPHNPCKRRHSLVARAHRQYEPALPTQRPRE